MMNMTHSKPSYVSQVRVLYFGMTGILSRVPLTRLLATGINVVGIVLPMSALPPYLLEDDGRPCTEPAIPQSSQPDSAIPLTPPDVLQLAAQYRLPVTAVRQINHPQFIQQVAQMNPDLILVSCFPYKFPGSLLNLPRHGCWNLHPSLLPHFRGPAPLFWTFWAGQNDIGVTLHRMDEGLDTGDILKQAAFHLPDSVSGPAAEQQLAELGGQLISQALADLADDTLSSQPQSGGGSYYPLPKSDDFRLDTSWSARRAFNFMRGTAVWGQPYAVEAGTQEIWLDTAVSFLSDQRQTEPIVRNDRTVSIQFNPGVLTAREIG
jgi:methionyl-tRNA formyltransferase